MVLKRSCLFLVSLSACFLLMGAAPHAQEAPQQKPPQKSAPQLSRVHKTPQQLEPQDPAQELSAVAVTIIIKSAIIALNQANLTGNYSVLRDLGTPVFRERFSQAHLADIFSNLRKRGVDLSLAIILSPKLFKQPEVKNGELHLEGEFPTEPLRIQFNLIVQRLDGIWRIAGLAVDAVAPTKAEESAKE